MPTGSLIPKLNIQHRPMPLSIRLTWWIFGFVITFIDNRTYIFFDTNHEQYLETMICIWHGRNPFWHPERGHFTENIWKITGGSMHWVMLAHVLEEHGFPRAKITILSTDVIQCQDALVEGSIFGIKSVSLLD